VNWRAVPLESYKDDLRNAERERATITIKAAALTTTPTIDLPDNCPSAVSNDPYCRAVTDPVI